MVSHTTTGEWQSFEGRMRRRRAERLVRRAEAAADAGFLDDARQCLSEARALAPRLPALEGLEEKLSASSPDATHRPRRGRVAAAAVLAVAATAVVAGSIAVSRSSPAINPVV